MKNIKLLIVTFLFSSLLIGCGMKGPLYRAPVTQPVSAVAPVDEKAESQSGQEQTEQDNSENNSESATEENPDNSSENTTTSK